MTAVRYDRQYMRDTLQKQRSKLIVNDEEDPVSKKFLFRVIKNDNPDEGRDISARLKAVLGEFDQVQKYIQNDQKQIIGVGVSPHKQIPNKATYNKFVAKSIKQENQTTFPTSIPNHPKGSNSSRSQSLLHENPVPSEMSPFCPEENYSVDEIIRRMTKPPPPLISQLKSPLPIEIKEESLSYKEEKPSPFPIKEEQPNVNLRDDLALSDEEDMAEEENKRPVSPSSSSESSSSSDESDSGSESDTRRNSVHMTPVSSTRSWKLSNFINKAPDSSPSPKLSSNLTTLIEVQSPVPVIPEPKESKPLSQAPMKNHSDVNKKGRYNRSLTVNSKPTPPPTKRKREKSVDTFVQPMDISEESETEAVPIIEHSPKPSVDQQGPVHNWNVKLNLAWLDCLPDKLLKSKPHLGDLHRELVNKRKRPISPPIQPIQSVKQEAPPPPKRCKVETPALEETTPNELNNFNAKLNLNCLPQLPKFVKKDESSQRREPNLSSSQAKLNSPAPVANNIKRNISQSDHYLKEGKRHKRAADSEENKQLQLIKYLEAAMFYILASGFMESEHRFEPAISVYDDTLKLVKYVVNKISNSDPRLTVLSLKCQSFLNYKIFTLKKHDLKEYDLKIKEHDKALKLLAHQPARTSPDSQTPSPGSVNSVGSSGYGSEKQVESLQKAKHLEQVNTLYKKQLNIYSYMHNASEQWEYSESLMIKSKVAEFFKEITTNVGHLNKLTGNSKFFVNYARYALSRFKKELSCK